MRGFALTLVVCALLAAGCAGQAPQRVEEAAFLKLGGIEQFVTIRGAPANPVLLLVHGGPGDVQSIFVEDYAPYERDFLLVQWDQRGAGRTYGRHGAATPDMTLDRIAADGIDLAEALRGRFPDSPIVLLGHSWGSVVGVEMARRRPDLFAAYVGTGQAGGWDTGVRHQYEFVRARAEAAGDAETLAALEALAPFDPQDLQDFLAVNAKLRAALGPADAAWLDDIVPHSAATASPEDLQAIGDGMGFSGQKLFADQLREDLFASAPVLELPVFVIQGAEDLFTPTPVARAYFDALTAPEKRMIVIEGAGHFALVTHQTAFLEALGETALPTARAAAR